MIGCVILKKGNISNRNINELVDKPKNNVEYSNKKISTENYEKDNIKTSRSDTYYVESSYDSSNNKRNEGYIAISIILFFVALAVGSSFDIFYYFVTNKTLNPYLFLTITGFFAICHISVLCLIKDLNLKNKYIISALYRIVSTIFFILLAIFVSKEMAFAVLIYIFYEIIHSAVEFVYSWINGEEISLPIILSVIAIISSYSLVFFMSVEFFTFTTVYVVVISVLLIAFMFLLQVFYMVTTSGCEYQKLNIIWYLFQLLIAGFIGYYCFYSKWSYWVLPVVVAVITGGNILAACLNHEEDFAKGIGIFDGILFLCSIAWMIVEYVVF